MKTPETVRWAGDAIDVLDQTLLPGEVTYKRCDTVELAIEAIYLLRVRGAPAIGVMAGYTLALAMRIAAPADRDMFFDVLESEKARIDAARPTAHNLRWALERCAAAAHHADARSVDALHAVLLEEAHAIAAEDRELCAAIGRSGASLVPEGGGILTHCNAGALATAGIGTALAPLYTAWDAGKRFQVFADETRPLWQGARLTAWELAQAGIPVKVLCDGAAASLLASGQVQLVIVGADRVAANGDVANKIGTYGVALAARAHDIPFYVAAPSTTFDLGTPTGAGIPIEQRNSDEIVEPMGSPMAPQGVEGWNPAFDITPHGLIAGFVTESGILRPPFVESIRTAFGRHGRGA